MAGEVHKLGDDLKEIPSWVWLGGAAAIGLLYVLGRAHGSSAAPSANPAGVSSNGSAPQVDLTTLDQDILALQRSLTAGGSQTITQVPTPGTGAAAYSPTALLPGQIYSPLTGQPGWPANINPATGLPWTGPPGGKEVQPAYGKGPSPLNLQPGWNPTPGVPAPDTTPAGAVSNPFAGVPGWQGVTQYTNAAGQQITNLGTAQAAPAPGQPIPPAVQDTVYYSSPGVVDWAKTLANAYTYPQGYQPGQVQR